jgi:hypothetical protein
MIGLKIVNALRIFLRLTLSWCTPSGSLPLIATLRHCLMADTSDNSSCCNARQAETLPFSAFLAVYREAVV